MEEAIQKVYDFHDTDYSKKIKPIKGVIEGINSLKKNNDLFIITSR
jgi:phosphoglycolate phosphatase-like HAD superfamily hydrolase